MMTDLQAYERQADSLTRALSGAENKADSGFREREALMEQLRGSKQTVLQLERARPGLQRDLATSEAHAEVMGARMEESSAEVLTLQHKVNLEQGRVKELEGLLASMLAKEHRQEVEGSILGSKSNSLISRNSMLEGHAGVPGPGHEPAAADNCARGHAGGPGPGDPTAEGIGVGF